MDDEIKSAKDAIQENQKLKQEIDVSWAILTNTHNPITHVNTTSFCNETTRITLRYLFHIPSFCVSSCTPYAGAEGWDKQSQKVTEGCQHDAVAVD